MKHILTVLVFAAIAIALIGGCVSTQPATQATQAAYFHTNPEPEFEPFRLRNLSTAEKADFIDKWAREMVATNDPGAHLRVSYSLGNWDPQGMDERILKKRVEFVHQVFKDTVLEGDHDSFRQLSSLYGELAALAEKYGEDPATFTLEIPGVEDTAPLSSDVFSEMPAWSVYRAVQDRVYEGKVQSARDTLEAFSRYITQDNTVLDRELCVGLRERRVDFDWIVERTLHQLVKDGHFSRAREVCREMDWAPLLAFMGGASTVQELSRKAVLENRPILMAQAAIVAEGTEVNFENVSSDGRMVAVSYLSPKELRDVRGLVRQEDVVRAFCCSNLPPSPRNIRDSIRKLSLMEVPLNREDVLEGAVHNGRNALHYILNKREEERYRVSLALLAEFFPREALEEGIRESLRPAYQEQYVRAFREALETTSREEVEAWFRDNRF